jgi:hypothetical protein
VAASLDAVASTCTEKCRRTLAGSTLRATISTATPAAVATRVRSSVRLAGPKSSTLPAATSTRLTSAAGGGGDGGDGDGGGGDGDGGGGDGDGEDVDDGVPEEAEKKKRAVTTKTKTGGGEHTRFASTPATTDEFGGDSDMGSDSDGRALMAEVG